MLPFNDEYDDMNFETKKCKIQFFKLKYFLKYKFTKYLKVQLFLNQDTQSQNIHSVKTLFILSTYIIPLFL